MILHLENMIIIHTYLSSLKGLHCVSWRQTKDCGPDGNREPSNDQPCDTKIDNRWSGYCECTKGRKTNLKGCHQRIYDTCTDACLILESKVFSYSFLFIQLKRYFSSFSSFKYHYNCHS